MRNKIISILILFIVTMNLSAQKVIKLAHDGKGNIFDHPGNAFALTFKSIVESSSNSSILVKVYNKNKLGTAKEQLEMTRKGIIQATITSVGALSSSYNRIGIIDLPFAFNSYLSAYSLWDGLFAKELSKDIENELTDIKVLGFPDTGGFFSITNSKKEIKTLADFKSLRIRTMTLESHQTIINSLGANAYPLPWNEVFSALEDKTIDGQMNPIATISLNKFYKVQKYLTLSNHLFTPYTFFINKEFYKSLSKKEKELIKRASKLAIIASRGIALAIENSETKGVSFLSKKMKITSLSKEVIEEIRKVTQPAIIKLINTSYDKKANDLFKLYLLEVKRANEFN